jgi:hypothetical protein
LGDDPLFLLLEAASLILAAFLCVSGTGVVSVVFASPANADDRLASVAV